MEVSLPGPEGDGERRRTTERARARCALMAELLKRGISPNICHASTLIAEKNLMGAVKSMMLDGMSSAEAISTLLISSHEWLLG